MVASRVALNSRPPSDGRQQLVTLQPVSPPMAAYHEAYLRPELLQVVRGK